MITIHVRDGAEWERVTKQMDRWPLKVSVTYIAHEGVTLAGPLVVMEDGAITPLVLFMANLRAAARLSPLPVLAKAETESGSSS